MNFSRGAVFALVALVVLVAAQDCFEDNCPSLKGAPCNPNDLSEICLECEPHPCDTECAAHPAAQCYEDACGGCTARWFDRDCHEVSCDPDHTPISPSPVGTRVPFQTEPPPTFPPTPRWTQPPSPRETKAPTEAPFQLPPQATEPPTPEETRVPAPCPTCPPVECPPATPAPTPHADGLEFEVRIWDENGVEDPDSPWCPTTLPEVNPTAWYSFNVPNGASFNNLLPHSLPGGDMRDRVTFAALHNPFTNRINAYAQVYDVAQDGTGGNASTDISSFAWQSAPGWPSWQRDDPGDGYTFNNNVAGSGGVMSTVHPWIGCCTDGDIFDPLSDWMTVTVRFTTDPAGLPRPIAIYDHSSPAALVASNTVPLAGTRVTLRRGCAPITQTIGTIGTGHTIGTIGTDRTIGPLPTIGVAEKTEQQQQRAP